jgi:hypothetical protein
MTLAKFPNFDLDRFLKEKDLRWHKHDAVDHTEYAINCPMCHLRGEPTPDTNKKLWLNIKNATFICYRCDWAGSALNLIRTYAKCDFGAAIKLLRGRPLDPMQHLNLSLVIDEPDYRDDEENTRPKTIELPYGYLPIDEPHPYLEERGIPWQYAAKNDWGISDAGYTKGRLIVPTFMFGEVVFWQARATWSEEEQHLHSDDPEIEYKKVLNPSGASNRHILYNYDVAKEFDKVILTEGFIDAAKVGEDAMATNGKRLHPQQVEMLQLTKAKEVVMMWDLDAWNDVKSRAKDKRSSIKKAADLLKSAGFKVRGVKMPDERDAGSYKYKSTKLREYISKAILL